MQEDLIISLYLNGESLRSIARAFNTNHKLIARILLRNNTPIRKRGTRIIKRKFECSRTRLYNNIQTHLRFDVPLDWLLTFKDVDKLKVLNRCITNRGTRFNEDSNWYKEFIEKFYYDEQFNRIYDKWLYSGKQFYLKPSVDHINPRSLGGCNSISNLQFLTWFENRCKNNLSQQEWDQIKNNIQEYFV